MITGCSSKGLIPIPTNLLPELNTSPSSSANYGSFPKEYQKLLQTYLKKNLTNPHNAKIEFVNTPKKMAITHLNDDVYGYRVCLSIDQKNIIVWSRMYDNIQESMDCPSDDVIQDDDMLDGWFIVQRKKQEKEKAKAELESGLTNSKISNSDEIFVVAGSKGDAERINDMNDIHGVMTKKERMAVIQKQGEAKDLDFRDQQLKVRRQSNEQYKGKFGR